MVSVICVFLIFVIIPTVLGMYSLYKAGRISEMVGYEQPDFFNIKPSYKRMMQINNTQFIFYIISGKYIYLKNEKLKSKCRRVRWIFMCSSTVLVVFIGSIVFYSMLTS